MKTAPVAALLLLVAVAFAADLAPWHPAPEMTGSFRSIAGDNHLEISSDARITLVFNSSDDVFVGTILPDSSGAPDRYLANVGRTSATADESDEREPGFLVLSFEPADAIWQLLGAGETPDDVQWIEDMPEYCDKRGGSVVHKDDWYETRFVSDRSLPAGAPEITPEAARQRLVGVWENFAGGFGGVTVILAPDGHGIFGASVLAMPCTWRVRKADDGWLLACKIYEGGPSPAKFTTSFALLKADSRLQRLRLLATDRTLEAATAAAESLDPAESPADLYRSSDTVPPELVERLKTAFERINTLPKSPTAQPAQ